VVVVECLFDGDEDTNVRFGDVVLRIVVPHFGIVVACIPLLIAYVEGGQTWVEGRGAHTNYQRVLWKLFEEALLDCAIHKEVQRLRGNREHGGKQRRSPHGEGFVAGWRTALRCSIC
jgi:hypothetical protein